MAWITRVWVRPGPPYSLWNFERCRAGAEAHLLRKSGRRQDREVLEDSNIAWILEGIQSGVKEFDLPFAIALLSQIAETANPPLLPALNNRRDVRKCIVENDELFNLLGECLQKESFSEIRSLEMLQSDHSEPPHTPPAGTRIRNAADELSPRLTLEQTERKTVAAFKVYPLIQFFSFTTSAGIVRGIRTIVKTANPNLALFSHLFGGGTKVI
ncbi:hypothetical protein BU17DRAFT_92028 [Hysterangium stoloniferum]|nr:hypothetical protein BU17DRAFT_92028 [Hysterangium stoloniferum]